MQDHGPRREGRGARDRPQRLGRRADPGGRGLAGRLRRRLRPQRPVLRRDSADQRDHGALRRRGRLLPRHDRLHLHGQGDLAHVHHGARGDQDGHGRGGRVRGARRRDVAQHQVGRRPLRRRRRGEVPGGRALHPLVPPLEQPRDATAGRAVRRPGARGPGARHPRPRRRLEAVRHARRDRPHRRRRRVLRGPRALGAEHRLRLRAPGRLSGGDRRQPARLPRRRPRHRLVVQGRTVRPHLRRVQHPAAHLHRRPRVPARAPRRSGAGSSATAPSCSTRSPRRRCRSSPSSPARRMAAPTTS